MLVFFAFALAPAALAQDAETPPVAETAQGDEPVVASADEDGDEAKTARVRGGNTLSKRAQLRYEDVLTTRDGSHWRGKITEKGDKFVIRLVDGSEVAAAAEEVASVSRELAPGFLHTGQWGLRASLGGEIAIVSADQNAGSQYGPLAELALTHNFKGPFEPELVLVIDPLGPEDGSYQWQLAFGTRYYLVSNRRAKPFTYTELVFFGEHRDLGLRTGPGFIWDLTPNLGIGVSQGVTLMSQADPKATGVGYHVLLSAQGRF
jgi:hypothetical protein